MQLITLAAAAGLIVPALSTNVESLDKRTYGGYTGALGKARVYNGCDYPVYLWSVFKSIGCDGGSMTTLKPGRYYEETFKEDGSDTGVSIKISKSQKCKGNIAKGENVDITQLEYYINHKPGYQYNFLDCSFVDCLGNDCPGRGLMYLKSGNNGDTALAKTGEFGDVCPMLSCSSIEECSKYCYVNWNDVRTKSCLPKGDLDYYLCQNNDSGNFKLHSAPDSDDSYSAPPSTSEKKPDTPKPQPTSSKQPETPEYKAVAAAEVTPAPKQEEAPKKVNIKTVIVTKYEYVNAKEKRHVHGHAHAHQRFHA